jgi:RNA polymerase sigma-70 factor (ECF subfamily)
VDGSRFLGPGDERSGHWSTLPDDWRGIPEGRLIGAETLHLIAETVSTLPTAQAEVIRLRDVLGWSAEEVRNALNISETNQRVLLHRARSRVRRAMDEYLKSGSA